MMTLSQAPLYISLFISLFFEVFILITYLETREGIKFEEEHLKKEITYFPSVTIIVPSFNEEASVSATVQSLLALDYPKDKMNLLLIDDGSTDTTLEVLNTFKNNPQVRIFSKANEGSKFSALNFGLTKIETELVGCLDADSFVEPGALKLMIPFFEDKTVKAVTPSIKVHEPQNVLQHIQRIEYNWGVFFRRMLSSMGAMYVTPGPFSIFRTEIFKELGGYRRAHHTEDLEIALRMQKNHYKIVNSVGAHVYTITPDKIKALYKQRVRWTYGFLNNALDYKDMFFNKKYGNVGVFILPVATISIFSSLFLAGTFIWNVGHHFGNAILKYQVVGFSTGFPDISLNWFFWNTNTLACVAVVAVTINISLLLLAGRIAKENKFMFKELFYYLTIYLFIVPFWVSRAMYNTIFARKLAWR